MINMGSLGRIRLLLISVLIILPTFTIAATTVETYSNTQVKNIRPVLDEFLYNVLKEYPYLYVHQNETNYNSIFEKDPKAFVLLARKDGKLIGALQANPLNSHYFKGEDYSPEKSLAKIKKNGFNPAKILYVSTFMFSKDERTNSAAINQMFDKTVEIAKKMGDTQICYMEIVEAKNHPLRPDSYISIEPWKELGRKIKNMKVDSTMSWPTLQSDGKVKNEEHKMEFYIIDL